MSFGKKDQSPVGTDFLQNLLTSCVLYKKKNVISILKSLYYRITHRYHAGVER